MGTEEDRRRAEQMANEIERNQESRHNQQLENDDEERDLDKETAFREAAEAHTDLNTTRTAAPQRRDFHRTRPFESAAKPQGQRAPPLVVPKCAGNGPRPNLTPSATPGNKKDPSPKPPKEQRSSPAPAQEVPAKQAVTTAPRAKEEVKKPKPSAEPVPVPPAKPAPPKKEPSISPKKTNNSVVAGKEAPAKKEVPKKKTSVPERAPSATPSVTPSMDDNASVVSATSTLSRKHSFNPHAVEFKPRAVPAAARSQAHTPTSPVQHMSQPQAPLQAVPPSALQHHMQLPPPHSGGMTMQHTPPTVPHMMTGNPYQVFQPPLQQPPQQMFLAQPQQQQQQHADYYLAQPQQQPQQQDFMQPVPVYYNMAAQQMGQVGILCSPHHFVPAPRMTSSPPCCLPSQTFVCVAVAGGARALQPADAERGLLLRPDRGPDDASAAAGHGAAVHERVHRAARRLRARLLDGHAGQRTVGAATATTTTTARLLPPVRGPDGGGGGGAERGARHAAGQLRAEPAALRAHHAAAAGRG